MEDELEGPEPEEQEPQAQQVMDWESRAKKLEAEKRELLSEVKQARAARRQQFLTAHSEFTEEDVKGIDLGRLEALLAKKAQQAPPTEAPVATEPHPEEATLAKAAQLGGTSNANLDSYRDVTALQADQKLASGEWSEGEYMTFINSRYSRK